MANRLMKKNTGLSFLASLDDWKESAKYLNEEKWNDLGEIFVSVNYDMKAFLSILYNSEAYQIAVEPKNEVSSTDYKGQGALLRRMSVEQIYDSLLTLKHGPLHQYSMLSTNYFNVRRELMKLSNTFIDDVRQLWKAEGRETNYTKREQVGYAKLVNSYQPKVKEVVTRNGYQYGEERKKKRKKKRKIRENTYSRGYYHHDLEGQVERAISAGDFGNFLRNFGGTDRASTKTDSDRGSNMQQILIMMNHEMVHGIAAEDSYLMREVLKEKNLGAQVKKLYWMVYARNPTRSDLSIAKKHFMDSTIFENKTEAWKSYVVAVVNSPEFFFIQ
jgi:hypothetical protein